MAGSVEKNKLEGLSTLLKVGLRLTSERDLDHLLQMIIEETTSVMDAERSSLFLTDLRTNEMWAKIAQGVDVIEIRFPVGVGIAGTVGQTGEIINIPDAYKDSRFNPEFDQKTGFRTTSILCVPMKNMLGKIIGAIQVLNKKSGTFRDDDESLLLALASQAAVAIENADLYTKLNELNSSLEEKVEERTAELVEANENLTSVNKKLEEISTTDSLTQVFNRRYFMERLTHEVKRVSRYGPGLSLLMIDIDHFKKVNDSHGHHGGDAVLAGIARVLKEALRETDLFARYGGEEFVVIATATESPGARTLAERLRKCVEDAHVEYDGKRIKVTISIGISTWKPSIKEDHEALIRQADAALYRAKDQGRNRVGA